MPGTDVETTSPARDLALAAARPEVVRLAAAAAAYADADQASNTRRAYQSDWRDFAAFCAQIRKEPLPADPLTVVAYLTALAESCRVSTLERRLAAIRYVHRAHDETPPDSARLRAVWSGIRRLNGRPPEQKVAIVTDDLKKIVRRLPATTAGVRDKALILLGFAGALRRSELAPLELDAGTGIRGPLRLRFVPQGAEIVIDRSKADQEGRGAVVGIPRGRTSLCPVAALKAWIELAGITGGPIFRRVDRWGHVSDEPMSGAATAEVVKRAAKKAGIDPDQVGGHSLRAGLVTEAIARDVAVPVIMQQTRHARVETLNRYVRQAERFTKNAAGKVGL